MIGGNRVPVVWGGNFELLRMLHEEADADVGEFGTGMDGIPETTSVEQAETLPYAARYLKCSDDAVSVCKEQPRYCATCWIERKDKVEPEAKQLPKPKGQVAWHPGWRAHQLQGRVLAFSVLEALQLAIQQFSDGTMGKKLPFG